MENQQVTPQKQSPSGQAHSHVAVAAVSMALGTFMSRVLGLVRDQLFAALFSPMVRDAWTAAFKLPNLFRRLLGEGSLSVSFIPVFVQVRHEDPSGVKAKNLVNSFYTLMLILLGVLTALGTIFPEFLLQMILDQKYIAVQEKYEQTVYFARIMFCFIFFMSTYAYFMGILNAVGKFALPALAPTLFNVAMIVANLMPQNLLAVEGATIAWGVVLGGAMQMLVLVPALLKAGFLPRLSARIFQPEVLLILRNMVPGLLGLGLAQITTIINLRFASSLGEGPITYIYLADRLLELPLSLVSVSLGTALLPTLAQYWSSGRKQEMIQTTNYYLRLNLFVAFPAAIALVMLGQPIVEVLFQRGQFSQSDANATALVVQLYSLILLTASCVRVVVPSYYAIKNTWLPAVVSGICLVIHFISALILVERMGLAGLIVASFISSGSNLILLMLLFRSFVGPFDFARLFKSQLYFLIPCAGLALSLLPYSFLQGWIFSLTEQLFFSRFMALLLVIPLGFFVYLFMAKAFKLEEYEQTVPMLIGKIKKKLKILS